MTDLLWMETTGEDVNPNYVGTFEAEIRKARGDWVMLDRTAFYAGGGGQPVDRGRLEWEDGEADVVDVSKRGVVKHVLEGPVPEEGTEVTGVLDWERRYEVMRAHTAQHLVSAVAHELHGVGTERARMEPAAAEIELAGTLGPDDVEETLLRSRELLDDERPVAVRTMRREAVAKHAPEGRANLDRAPDQPRLRVVEIEDLDLCPCGGTHVARTDEIAPLAGLERTDDGAGLRLELGPTDPAPAERKR